MVIFQLFLFSLNSQREDISSTLQIILYFSNGQYQQHSFTSFSYPLLPFPLFLKKVTFSFHYNSYYFSVCYVYLSLKLSQRCFLAIYLFLAVLGAPCCKDFSLAAISGGYSLFVVCGLLTVVASLVVKHGLWDSWAPQHRFDCCGEPAWTMLLCSMWDLPRSGITPVSPALAGRFFTTEPPGSVVPSVPFTKVFLSLQTHSPDFFSTFSELPCGLPFITIIWSCLSFGDCCLEKPRRNILFTHTHIFGISTGPQYLYLPEQSAS